MPGIATRPHLAREIAPKRADEEIRVEFAFAQRLFAAGEVIESLEAPVCEPSGLTALGQSFSGLACAYLLTGGIAAHQGVSDPDTDMIQATSHGMSVGDRVIVRAAESERLPTPLKDGAIYWVVATTADAYQLATHDDGEALSFGSAAAVFVGVEYLYTVTINTTLGQQRQLTGRVRMVT